MHLDVRDLRGFYYQTRLGRSAQRALQAAIGGLWSDTHGLIVAGYGFAAPVMRPFLRDSRAVINLMPAQQGVMPWPAGGDNLCALVEETDWPIEAGILDRIIVLHGLETCDRPDALLDEIWRVLSPGGRVLFVVPNRSGLWAQRDATPFGFGRPYSIGQLETLLSGNRFVAERHATALYAPPSHRRFWHQTAHFWEGYGRRFRPLFGAGALVVEASKQVFARPESRRPRLTVPGPLDMLEGLAGPVHEPVRGRGVVAADPSEMPLFSGSRPR
jgi:SAM-dependent methyltransferase